MTLARADARRLNLSSLLKKTAEKKLKKIEKSVRNFLFFLFCKLCDEPIK